MNSFEQLRQEAETRETIIDYRREHPPVGHKRLKQVRDEFGAKHPGEIDMWRTVWDDFNIGYDEGIPEAYLPEAVKGALGLTDNRAIDAVSIGKEFDLLLEAEPVESIDLKFGDDEDDTILRLVSPQERPDLYCEDVEQYADREKWAELWSELGFDGDHAFVTANLINILTNKFDIDTEEKAKAAIEVGSRSESILKTEDGYILSGERPQKYWLEIWDTMSVKYEATLSNSQLKSTIAAQEMVKANKAAEMIEDAVERGELYSPDDADDDELAINDPSSEEGPEIERKIGIDTDDDDPDDDNDQSDTEQSDGDSPDSTAPSEEGAAETSPSENGTALRSDSNSSDGEIGGVDNDSETASNQIEEPGGDDNKRSTSSADNLEDQLSPKETFGYWKQVQEHGILDAKIPTKALIYYALEHGIATRDDLEERDGEHGEFETLPLDKKRETLAKIGEDHGVDITWANYHNAVTKPDTNSGSGTPRAADKTRDGESDSGGSAESSSGQSGGSGEQSSAGESGGTESATSSASAGASSDETSQSTGVKIGGDTSDDSAGNEGDQPAGDDDDEEIPNTTTNDAGLDTGYLASEVDVFDDPNAGDGEQGGDGDGEGGGTAKFHTYEEPGEKSDDFDVDRDAVKQFVDAFCQLDTDTNRELKTHKDRIYNSFTTWVEINNLDLDELGEDVFVNHRKGNLKQILLDLHDLTEGKYTVDDERAYGFGGIELSEVGEELLDIDLE